MGGNIENGPERGWGFVFLVFFFFFLLMPQCYFSVAFWLPLALQPGRCCRGCTAIAVRVADCRGCGWGKGALSWQLQPCPGLAELPLARRSRPGLLAGLAAVFVQTEQLRCSCHPSPTWICLKETSRERSGSCLGFAERGFSCRKSPGAPLPRPFGGGTCPSSARCCRGRCLRAAPLPLTPPEQLGAALTARFPGLFVRKTEILEAPDAATPEIKSWHSRTGPRGKLCPSGKGDARRLVPGRGTEVCRHHHLLSLQLFPLSEIVLTPAI